MSLRSKLDLGAPDRDLKLKAKQRARETALRAALAKLEGGPTVIKGETLPAEPMPAACGSDDLTCAEKSAQLTAKASQGSAANMPVTERTNTEPSYMRNGVQWRPMTRFEREEEENNRLDKQAVDRYAAYCELVQSDIDLSEAQERQRQQRESRERRTGMRSLPQSGDHCSLIEAARRGYIGRGE